MNRTMSDNHDSESSHGPSQKHDQVAANQNYKNEVHNLLPIIKNATNNGNDH